MPPTPDPSPPRRIVRGHDTTGRSVVFSDGVMPTSQTIDTGMTFHEIWATSPAPAPIAAAEPTARDIQVAPDPLGTIVQIIDMPPGSHDEEKKV